MNEKIFNQINTMRTEIFPLDRILPKNTVFSIFLDTFNKTKNKSDFMKNSEETKRLRQAYWGLFACAALDIVEDENHFMHFPSKPENDVDFLSRNISKTIKTTMNCLKFDVKEFTSHSLKDGFELFIKEKINPQRNIYGIIIGIHEDIGILKSSTLLYNTEDHGLIIIATKDQDNESITEADVLFIYKNKVVLDEKIDLLKFMRYTDTPVIYQNNLRIVET